MWSLVCYIVSFLIGYFLFATYNSKKQTDHAVDIPKKRRKISLATLKHKRLSGLTATCRDIGLSDCYLTIGVDFTASNEWQGRRTYNQQCLHLVSPVHSVNPYQRTILAFGSSLAPVLTSQPIAAFGFGDSTTKGYDVFPLNQKDGGQCDHIEHVLKCYRQSAASVVLSGPTSFVPIIRKSIEMARRKPSFHILLIIADGCMADEAATNQAIQEAHKHPISVILVGVGDGPWGQMYTFSEKMAEYNFNFVEFDSCSVGENPSESLLLHAFVRIPDQYEAMKRKGLIRPEVPSQKILNAGISPTDEKKILHSAGKAKKLKFRLRNSLKIVDYKLNRIRSFRKKEKALKSLNMSDKSSQLNSQEESSPTGSSGRTCSDDIELYEESSVVEAECSEDFYKGNIITQVDYCDSDENLTKNLKKRQKPYEL